MPAADVLVLLVRRSASGIERPLSYADAAAERAELLALIGAIEKSFDEQNLLALHADVPVTDLESTVEVRCCVPARCNIARPDGDLHSPVFFLSHDSVLKVSSRPCMHRSMRRVIACRQSRTRATLRAPASRPASPRTLLRVSCSNSRQRNPQAARVLPEVFSWLRHRHPPPPQISPCPPVVLLAAAVLQPAPASSRHSRPAAAVHRRHARETRARRHRAAASAAGAQAAAAAAALRWVRFAYRRRRRPRFSKAARRQRRRPSLYHSHRMRLASSFLNRPRPARRGCSK
jgi:hypothetical protein